MEKKKKISKTPKKTTKTATKKVEKKTSSKKRSKKKKGFTLIELLAVIIILGILMIIAIPSVTKYISDSRKSTYVDTASAIVTGARNMVNEGKLQMFDTDTTYYINAECIKTEGSSKSPYGEFVKAYVVVTYDGKGYDYYWTSIDEVGNGVKKITKLENLKEDSIESDLKVDDIKDSVGIDGRSKYMIIDKNTNCNKGTTETITKKINGETGEEITNICKRATTLHKETCRNTREGCYISGYYIGGSKNTKTITYGSKGTPGVLSSGDAFDCDVNGDGNYDSVNERFYYVSPYYDTHSLSFDTSYAVLIASKDYYSVPNSNGDIMYDSTRFAYYGPRTALSHLPSIDEWSNVKLKNTDRAILAEWKTDHNITTIGSNHNLPSNFSYIYNNVPRAARLITAQEVMRACGLSQACTFTAGDMSNCDYMLEKLDYAVEFSNTNAYLFESPLASQFEGTYSCILMARGETASLENTCRLNGGYGIRPVIELPLYDIDY